jgi:hypothetical protein
MDVSRYMIIHWDVTDHAGCQTNNKPGATHLSCNMMVSIQEKQRLDVYQTSCCQQMSEVGF